MTVSLRRSVRGGGWRARLGVPMLAFIAVAVLLLPPLVPYAPDQPDFVSPLVAPDLAHPFGTDDLGRDVLARVLSGGRVSLEVALGSVAVSVCVGVPFGLASGYLGGWTDRIAVRLLDMLLAFPGILLALGLASSLGPSAEAAALAICMMNTPVLARIARAQAMVLRGLDYVAASRVAGSTSVAIVLRCIAPNAAGPLLVEATSLIAAAMVTEATLSFLGLGIQPPQPSLGGMLRDATSFVAQAPWLAWFPGLVLSASVFSLNLIGEALRDRVDPAIRVSA
jgi:peptide/nickel transport system permease protein